MRHFFASFLLLLIVAGGGYFTVRALTRNPCEETRTYSIGFIDPRFGISTSSVESLLRFSSGVWNTSYSSSSLLAFSPFEGDIRVNFVYDERQRATIQNEKLKQTITHEKQDLEEIKDTLESLRSEYDSLEASIHSRMKSYSERLATHNEQVTYWNKRGGAPTDVYKLLQIEAENLETIRIKLNTDISRFNSLAERIRHYGKDHNEMVSDINEKIENLNDRALRDFEEGTYDPATRTITIYEYANENSLKRVLIHELGHALRLDHVEDEEAIMYPVNQGKNLTLADADKEELAKQCSVRPLDSIRIIRDDIVRLVVSSWHGISAQQE